jgi:hypothetical protein
MTLKRNENRFVDGLLDLILAFGRIFTEGLKSKFYKKIENIFVLVLCAISFSIFIKKEQFRYFTFGQGRSLLILALEKLSSMVGYPTLVIAILLLLLGCGIILYGVKPYRRFRAYQKGLDHLNLKSGLDHRPKLIAVDSIDQNRTRLLVKSTGLGEERYKTKLDDLRASVGERIESVRFLDSNSTFVEIFLAKKLLESRVMYAEVEKSLKRPFSFIIGKSQSHLVMESLEKVPHYLIAGSTGGGKSVAFKSMLIGLLETSSQLQVYLFDFKRVEMNEFSILPNVMVVNQEVTAQVILSNLEKEMEKRFRYLESRGFREIDPVRDKLDRIVVGIDECTDLTGKVAKSHPDYITIEKARLSLDHLSRKARACGIHLILATQKIDSDSLDTRVQENIEGRLGLRMNTMENSVRVLQNSMAYHLPSIPGRAIWKKGSGYTEVQCPFLSDQEIKTRLQILKASIKFESVKLLNFSTTEEQQQSENNKFSTRRN